ncbi:MAG: hypothetical protein AAFY15_05750 [Cyanobacteria bacterium J06648_11]
MTATNFNSLTHDSPTHPLAEGAPRAIAPLNLDRTQPLDAAIAQLERATGAATERARQQAEAVTNVLALVRESEGSSRQSAALVSDARTALSELREAIASGEVAAIDLSADIEHLQARAERFEHRMHSLAEFVEVADRFVQDQSQIAALTQTLAMSATLLSARASAQRDPNQFLPLALEFGAVADRVKQLAEQTNRELGALRRRSTQVREAVAGANTEVRDLSDLVARLTDDAARSRTAIARAEQSSLQVVRVEQASTASQHEAVEAATDAARVAQDVIALAEGTVEQTDRARSQLSPIRAGVEQLRHDLASSQPSPLSIAAIVALEADRPDIAPTSG